MPDLNEQYEKEHLQNIVRQVRKIKALYGEAIDTVSLTASSIQYKGQTFKLSDYPRLQKVIEQQIQKLHSNILIEITDGIKNAWDLSNKKNNLLIDKRLAGKNPKPKAKQILYDPNEEALKAFVNRKEKGLNLSDRVWNTLEPFKPQLEQGLAVGISEGRAAKEMARDLKQYLNQPDKLFRRVRNAKGELKLSKAAKEYRPGQGVYRSSYKNALRLTATETNIAYRTADHERWNKLPFVTGIEVKLSTNHPKYDICDEVKGEYPKDFKFVGWHPHCLCHAIPKMASDEEYDKIEDAILGISDDPPDLKQVETVPPGFKKYLEENKEKIAGWKNKPYWMRDNKEYL